MSKTVFGICVVVLILLTGATACFATVRISGDEGGATSPYHRRYKAIARSGEQVVIDGPCYSACTLVFQYVPANRICATPRAVLGVHKFWWRYPNGRTIDDRRATLSAIRGYPKPVQAYIAAHGGYGAMPANGYWYLRGADTGVQPCR